MKIKKKILASTQEKSIKLSACLSGTHGEAPKLSIERVEHVYVASCSVELTRNAKGAPQWVLKGTCETGQMTDLVDHLVALDRTMRARLMPEGPKLEKGDSDGG